MLTHEQVIPFLSSDDPILRDQAFYYFEHANDVGPLTAVDCWTAINRVGLNRFTARLLDILGILPQSDDSTRELLAALDAPSHPHIHRELLDALNDIDFDQLRRHREVILARSDLSDATREHLQSRLELAQLPPDALWQQFDQHALASENVYWNELDRKIAARLIEAIASHGQDSVDRALAILNDPKYNDSAREIYAIDLLARLRYRPAMELLIQRFVDSDDDDDVLHESLQDALPVIGGVDIVAPIEAVFLKQSWTFQLYAAGTLAHVHHPETEAALLRLIEAPDIDDIRENIAGALAELCTTAGLTKLRQIVIDDDYDPSVFDLKQDLVACALMAGYDFPELPAMREEVVAKNADYRRRLESGEFDYSPIDSLDDDLGEENFEDDEDYEEDDYADYPALPPALDDRQPIIEPIVNRHPKIGRNDPCPCGSGKKYKKCCLR